MGPAAGEQDPSESAWVAGRRVQLKAKPSLHRAHRTTDHNLLLLMEQAP